MADDELNSAEPAQTEHTNHNLPEEDEPGEGKASQARITELEGLLTQKSEELRLANARTTELEQVVANLESEVAALKQSAGESDQRLAEAGNALSQAIASYKALVLESNPVVPPEMIIGDTIEAINDSLKSARELITKVRSELEAETKTVRIPAGAPQRTPPDLSALSPREKIQYAIGGNK